MKVVGTDVLLLHIVVAVSLPHLSSTRNGLLLLSFPGIAGNAKVSSSSEIIGSPYCSFHSLDALLQMSSAYVEPSLVSSDTVHNFNFIK